MTNKTAHSQQHSRATPSHPVLAKNCTQQQKGLNNGYAYKQIPATSATFFIATKNPSPLVQS